MPAMALGFLGLGVNENGCTAARFALDRKPPAVLLGARIRLVCSLLAPCAAGASVISVRHRIYEQDHLGCRVEYVANLF